MSNNSYTPKPRPAVNFATSDLMGAILNGGGSHAPIQREAYFARPNEEKRDITLDDMPLPHIKPR